MNAKIVVSAKQLFTTADGEYMEVTFMVSVLNSRAGQLVLPLDRAAYDYLEPGKLYELTDSPSRFPAVVATEVEAVEATELEAHATEVPPAPDVPQCGAFEACELPLGHEGPHAPDASARESTPESEPAQEVEGAAATL